MNAVSGCRGLVGYHPPSLGIGGSKPSDDASDAGLKADTNYLRDMYGRGVYAKVAEPRGAKEERAVEALA